VTVIESPTSDDDEAPRHDETGQIAGMMCDVCRSSESSAQSGFPLKTPPARFAHWVIRELRALRKHHHPTRPRVAWRRSTTARTHLTRRADRHRRALTLRCAHEHAERTYALVVTGQTHGRLRSL
jgi:hypothetical protein